MRSLTSIANEEGTDKGTLGPVDDWTANGYTDVYEAYLHPLRQKPIALLEIGLGVDGPNWHAAIAQGRNAGGGASLRMWSRYFPYAQIFGIDINSATFLDNDRVHTGVVDQGDPTQIRTFLAEKQVDRLDIIVDDGSHRPDHQQISFETLFPYLRPGGLYFIEDLMANGMGDGMSGRHADEKCLNTRRVFRGFQDERAFPLPNAFGDSVSLAQQIDSVVFHCPARVLEGDLRMRDALRHGWPLRRRTIRSAFALDDERLCVIRKCI
jgi:hypothetical protein